MKNAITTILVLAAIVLGMQLIRISYQSDPYVSRAVEAEEALEGQEGDQYYYRQWIEIAYDEVDRTYLIELIRQHSGRYLLENMAIIGRYHEEPLDTIIPLLNADWKEIQREYEIYLLSPEETRGL